MHSDAVSCAKISMRRDGLGRIHVHRLHEPSRLVAADAEEGDIGTAEPLPDGSKMPCISGIAGEIDGPPAAFDEIAAPKAVLPVAQAAGGEMLRRDEGKAAAIAKRECFPPVEFVQLPKADRRKNAAI